MIQICSCFLNGHKHFLFKFLSARLKPTTVLPGDKSECVIINVTMEMIAKLMKLFGTMTNRNTKLIGSVSRYKIKIMTKHRTNLRVNVIRVAQDSKSTRHGCFALAWEALTRITDITALTSCSTVVPPLSESPAHCYRRLMTALLLDAV